MTTIRQIAHLSDDTPVEIISSWDLVGANWTLLDFWVESRVLYPYQEDFIKQQLNPPTK